MKTVVTLLLVVFMGVVGLAKNQPALEKVSTLKKGVILENTTLISFKNLDFNTNKQITRLYMYKNSRVLRELSFRTKRNKTRQA